jgi:uncharacterized protein YndB with AHSA1/START domain
MRKTVHSDTQAISIEAPPEAVLDVIADPRKLPLWAPTFARTVRADGDAWIVDTGEREVRRRIDVSREHGTVDFVSATGGFFTRVIRNGVGSELMFTSFAAPGEDEAGRESRRATVAQELENVRALAEG